MKKKFLSISLLLAGLANAEVPKEFPMYNTFAAGTMTDLSCRTLISEYNSRYGSKAVQLNKIGASGLLAVRDVINNPQFALGCGTTTLFSVNHFTNPEQSDELNQIKPVITTLSHPEWFYVGPKQTAKTLEDLIEHAKKNDITLKVGGWPGSKLRADALADKAKVKITFINFAKHQDMIPVLMDGSLDIAMDSGTLLSFVETDKIRLLGYLALHNININAPNINKTYPIANFGINQIIFTSKNVSQEDTEELYRRFAEITKSKVYRDFHEKYHAGIIALSPSESIEAINQHYKSVLRLWGKK